MRAVSKNAPVIDEIITYITDSRITEYSDLVAYAKEHNLTKWQRVMAKKKYEYLFRIYLAGQAEYLEKIGQEN